MFKLIEKKSYQHRVLIKSIFWRAFQTAAKQGSSFLMFFIAVYYLSPDELGTLSYLMAIIGLLLIVCDFGFSQSVTRYITKLKWLFEHREKWESMGKRGRGFIKNNYNNRTLNERLEELFYK